MEEIECLYKYRVFSARTINLLLNNQIYFANPQEFNDPMEVKPEVKSDVTEDVLLTIAAKMMKTRITNELEAAAEKLRYKGPQTKQQIEKLGVKEVLGTISSLQYDSTNPEYDDPDKAYIDLLLHAIQNELRISYGSGIFAMSATFDCPTMWSHYADQHRGLCIGYKREGAWPKKLLEVTYDGSREISASLIAKALDNDLVAKEELDRKVLAVKAKSWTYEMEWRLIGWQGEANSNLSIDSIMFGSRCPASVMWATRSTLVGRFPKIHYYKMHETPEKYGLRRYEIDWSELVHHYSSEMIDRNQIERYFKPVN